MKFYIFLTLLFFCTIFCGGDTEAAKCPKNKEPSPDCNYCSRSCENDLLACTLMGCIGDDYEKPCICKAGYRTDGDNCTRC
uniref:Uncharacterized protein n=1 Tax=Acrobeloides nanus TaxID=290746 RepID=A0A914DK47_9BILA